MNSILFCIFASCFASLANLFFRKGSEHSTQKNSYSYYLLFFYFISFIFSLLLSLFQETSTFNPIMFGVGSLVGCLNVAMMSFTRQALLSGPAGLTFAFQNVSAIFPGLILFGLFGPLFGFQITLFQIIGMGLVVWGLFLGSIRQEKNQAPSKYLKYVLGCFIAQILALSLIHWRCLLFASDIPPHILVPWNFSECADFWFLPGQFGTAFFLQLGSILLYERKTFNVSEIGYGILGGIVNGISSFALMFSTKIASPFEKVLIFPCFAVATMIICNVWANRLYQERFNLASNSFCAIGVFLGSVF